MKKITGTIIAVILSVAAVSTANGSNNSVNGLIIGTGSGALLGQAVGRNTESTIVGATVGGVIGLIIGSELEGRRVVVHQHNHRPPGPRVHYRGGYHRPHYGPVFKKKGNKHKRYPAPRSYYGRSGHDHRYHHPGMHRTRSPRQPDHHHLTQPFRNGRFR